MPFILDLAKKIPKEIVKKLKNLKTTFRHYFQPKQDEIGREREKKNFTSEFRLNPTRARKFRKKLQKNWKN